MAPVLFALAIPFIKGEILAGLEDRARPILRKFGHDLPDDLLSFWEAVKKGAARVGEWLAANAAATEEEARAALVTHPGSTNLWADLEFERTRGMG